jgi:hypothetical protein
MRCLAIPGTSVSLTNSLTPWVSFGRLVAGGVFGRSFVAGSTSNIQCYLVAALALDWVQRSGSGRCGSNLATAGTGVPCGRWRSSKGCGVALAGRWVPMVLLLRIPMVLQLLTVPRASGLGAPAGGGNRPSSAMSSTSIAVSVRTWYRLLGVLQVHQAASCRHHPSSY